MGGHWTSAGWTLNREGPEQAGRERERKRGEHRGCKERIHLKDWGQEGSEPGRWRKEQTELLRKCEGRPILFRDHPNLVDEIDHILAFFKCTIAMFTNKTHLCLFFAVFVSSELTLSTFLYWFYYFILQQSDLWLHWVFFMISCLNWFKEQKLLIWSITDKIN